MLVLYSAGIGLYHAAVRCSTLWNPKARAWVDGRRELWQRLEGKRAELKGCLWMHCASVGEFEQGRPVLEAIKAARPELPVLLTFFSPSGFEVYKDYALAEHVDYLPADSDANAAHLMELIAPRACLFVKYEFWYHHLQALKANSVPTFLVSAIFRKDQPFFSWFGGAWRKMLGCYTHIFTQDEGSRQLLAAIGITNASVSGDTRFDRVMAIAEANEELDTAKAFCSASKSLVLVCGSTWPKDEQLILSALEYGKTRPRVIVAPHELNAEHLGDIEACFPKPLITWTEATAASSSTSSFPIDTLLVDGMGMLARLYKYADIAYIGGGFGDGIHSLLEAAAWGKPVIFGPHHRKFPEAQALIDAGAGFEVRTAAEMHTVLDRLLNDPVARAAASVASKDLVRAHMGAKDRVVEHVLSILLSSVSKR